MSCLCSLVFNLNYKAIITARTPGCQQWNPGLICSESINPSSALEDFSPSFFQSGHFNSPLSHFHNYACPVTDGVKTLSLSKPHISAYERFAATAVNMGLSLPQFRCCFCLVCPGHDKCLCESGLHAVFWWQVVCVYPSSCYTASCIKVRAFLGIEDISASPHFFTGLFKVHLALRLKFRTGVFF